MLNPVKWEEDRIPAHFESILWRGDGSKIGNAPGVVHTETKTTIFKLELSPNDARQLIDGNPIYLAINGQVPPFCVSANLGELIDIVSGE